MPRLPSLFLASGVLGLPSPVVAQPSSAGTHHEIRLSWVRSASAASCPDAGRVEADVEQRLGWSPFIRTTGASESIEAAVTRDSDVWRAAIVLRAADGSSLGTREVASPAATCASLSAAAGLAIALMIEPFLPEAPARAASVAPSGAAPGARAAATKSAVATATKAAGSTEPDRRGPRDTRGNLALGALAVVRVLPHASLGATLTGSTRLLDRLFGSVSVSFLPEQHLHRDGADVGLGMTLGSIGPCYRIPIGQAWSLSSCVSLLLGSLQVAVTNPAPVSPGARFWWAASTGLRLGWSLGPFDTALGVDALAHVTRHSYLIARAESPSAPSLFVEPAIALMGSLVLGVRY